MDTLLRRRQMMLAGGSPTPPGPVVEPVFYDRLVFDGVAKIETTFVLPENFSIRVSLGNETNKAAQRVFRATGDGGYVALIYGSATTSTNRALQIYYDSTSSNDNTTRAFSSSLYFWMTPKKWGYGNTARSYTKGNAHPTGGLVFGGWDSGNPYSGTMGDILVLGSDAQNATSFSDLLNYTPVATFKPCTYNGEAGLWLVETSTFFGNTAGAGTLTVRNDE